MLNVSAGTSYGPLSVSVSVTSRYSIKSDERINLVFGTGQRHRFWLGPFPTPLVITPFPFFFISLTPFPLPSQNLAG